MTLPRVAGLAIAAAFLFAGLLGHDPWKPDEGYTFGLVLHVLQTGDWVVPALAGEPFMEKPPLYYLTAASMAFALQPFLPLHDGARVASTLYVAIAALTVALSSRRTGQQDRGLLAAMLFLGTFGLAPHAHELVTDTALLAGFGIAFLGLTWARERPEVAGALLGTGVGIGFMSKGLVEPAMVGLACIALPLAFPAWRRAAYGKSLVWASLFAAPWLLAWPAALYAREPALFREWLWTNNFGRYFGFANLGADDEPWYYTRTLPWFTLPSGAVAAWGLWDALRRRQLAEAADLQLCVVMTAAMLLVLSTASTARAFYALPLLVPLSVAASRAAPQVQRAGFRAALAFAALALVVMLFSWGCWVWAMATGDAPPVIWLHRWLPTHFTIPFEPPAFVAALLLTALWGWSWYRARDLPWTHLWLANVCAAWGVSMTLLMPWIDNARSFRLPFSEIARYVQPGACVHGRGLGEPQRGMLHYVAGLKTLPLPPAAPAACAYVLIQTSHSGARPPLPPGRWRLLWEGARPGEDHERFSLWRSLGDDLQLAGERMSRENVVD